MDSFPDEPVASEPMDDADLAQRLANYRSRVAREGRKSALERLDRAIDKATRKPSAAKSPPAGE